MSPGGDGGGPERGAVGSGRVPLGLLLRDLAAATLHLHAAAADRAGMAPSDLAALHQLAAGPLSHRDLSARLGLRPASTTTVVERLVGRGHAERHRRPDDGRSVLVGLTDAGRETARTAFAAVISAAGHLDADLGPHEHAVVAGFLRRAAAAVSSAAGATAVPGPESPPQCPRK